MTHRAKFKTEAEIVCIEDKSGEEHQQKELMYFCRQEIRSSNSSYMKPIHETPIDLPIEEHKQCCNININKLTIEQEYVHTNEAQYRGIEFPRIVRSKQSSCCRWSPARLIQILVINQIVIVSIDLIQIVSKVGAINEENTNNNRQTNAIQRIPPGANCLIVPNSEQVEDIQVKPVKNNQDDEYNILNYLVESQAINNSIRLIRLNDTNNVLDIINNKTTANGQRQQFLVFDSICGGWRNSLQQQQPKYKQPAYWVLDRARGAIVAKFDFYGGRQQFLDLDAHVASLKSPLFRPIPLYHSIQQSKYYKSCQIKFRFYLNVRAHLELRLVPVPNINNHNNGGGSRSTSKQIKEQQDSVLFDIIETKGLQRNKNDANSGDEQLGWRAHEVGLPVDLDKSSPYWLEFVAMPSTLKTDSFSQTNFLNGIAISNISMTPQCFGVDVDEDELERLRTLPGYSDLELSNQADYLNYQQIEDDRNGRSHFSSIGFQRSFNEFIETHKTLILFSVILVLVIVAVSSQWILCAYHQQSWRGYQISNQKGPFGDNCFLNWLCCCCLLCTKRSRVYSAENSAQKEHLNGKDQFDQRNHLNLRPISAAIFENVEMNENPNYLANGMSHGMSLFKSPSMIRLESFHIDRKRLTLTRRLGKGAFGEVYQGSLVCHCSDDGETIARGQEPDNGDQESHSMKVAVKTLTDERMSSKDFVQEAKNMMDISHRNIVKLIGVCFDEKPLFIVMELIEGGNLKNFLIKNRDKGYFSSNNSQNYATNIQLASTMDSQQSQRNNDDHNGQPNDRIKLCMGDLLVFALDIARACHFLQQNQILHRDLAARNCLLTSCVRNNSSPPIQQPFGADPSGHQSTSGGRNRQQHQQMRTFVGSPPSAMEVNANYKVNLEEVYLNGYMNSSIVAKLSDFGMTRTKINDYYRMGNRELPVRWMPPECLDGVATTKSDVWSFGIFLWELFSMGQLPYQNLLDNKQVMEFIKWRRHKSRPSSANKSAQDLPLLMAISDDNMATVGTQHQLLLQDQQQLLLMNGNSSTSFKGNINNLANNGSDNLAPELDDYEAANMPPLPPPHDNTPHPIYSIMCSCWATNPEERPQFDEIANRLYWCLQMPQVLNTSLPCFYEPHTPSSASVIANAFQPPSPSPVPPPPPPPPPPLPPPHIPKAVQQYQHLNLHTYQQLQQQSTYVVSITHDSANTTTNINNNNGDEDDDDGEGSCVDINIEEDGDNRH